MWTEDLREVYRQIWTNYRHYSSLRFVIFTGFITLNSALGFFAFWKGPSSLIPIPLVAVISIVLSIIFWGFEFRIRSLMHFYRRKAEEMESKLGISPIAAHPIAKFRKKYFPRFWRSFVTGSMIILYSLPPILFITSLWPWKKTTQPAHWIPTPGFLHGSDVEKIGNTSMVEIIPLWITAIATVFLAIGVVVAMYQFMHNVKVQNAKFLAELQQRLFTDRDLLSAIYCIDYHQRGYPGLKFKEAIPEEIKKDKFTFEVFATSPENRNKISSELYELYNISEMRPLEWRIDKLLSFFQLLGALSSKTLNLLDLKAVKSIFGYFLGNALLHPAIYTYIRFLREEPPSDFVSPRGVLEFPDFVRLAKEVLQERSKKSGYPLMLVATEAYLSQKEIEELKQLAGETNKELPEVKDKRLLKARTIDEKEELIGYILYKQDDQVLHIDQLVIAEKFRRQGYGKALLRLAEAFARACGLKMSRVIVPQDNEAACAFLKKLGYEKRLDSIGTSFIFEKKIIYE